MKNITPRRAVSKAYLKAPVSRPEIEQFKRAFVTMQGQVKAGQLEAVVQNHIRDFLLDAYYRGEHEINAKDRKDLVIHLGSRSTDDVGVILEAKAPDNSSEMVTQIDLNKKAMHELLRYYLHERVHKGNSKLKHLIITNGKDWFIFDATDWERAMYGNKKLVKDYQQYRLDGYTTDYFYREIAKPYIAKVQQDLVYTYFDISKYKNIITNDDSADDRKLVALFKLLSPTHMLKLPFANDSNSLNKNFYNELLHIIGLEEVSQRGKKVIQRKAEGKREPGSLLENALNILKYETNVAPAKHYDTALELCITWVNRVLFLKLLESQLVKYNQQDENYRFLHFGRISNYDALNKLFFQVLAIKPEDRRPRVQEEYSKVPYLNSSLFEVSPVEAQSLKISGLEDDSMLSTHSATVLKGASGRRAKGELNPLEYLFRFLEAYNFSSEGGEQIQEESKSLINASVLGLIFEKINGYKDGSFFTPGFITMYMCRETIRRSVLQKFREQTDYDSEDWDELKNYIGKPYKIEDLQQYNALIDSIKICDPAVGSGHFLVSALNEMIAIKSELGILWDGTTGKLSVLATVDNDELILENDDADHELYEYDYRSKENQRVQQAIFNEKKKIIENCLFGVDINPNSVKICRLRLWIELLKNAYYTAESNYTDLETLPNIDINIKCGNSLISRFDLDSDLSSVFGKDGNSKGKYLNAVTAYKQTAEKQVKQELETYIESLKKEFKTTLISRDPRFAQLSKWRGDLNLIRNKDKIGDLFGKLSDSKENKKKLIKKAGNLEKKIAKLEQEIQVEKDGQFYKKSNAFEWRFEFPEVLDDEGEYVGFDVVIGNPPYMGFQIVPDKEFLATYEVATGKYDLYVLFIELLGDVMAKTGVGSYIIPHKYLVADFGKGVRQYLSNEKIISNIVSFGERMVFDDATTYTCITEFKRASQVVNYCEVVPAKLSLNKEIISKDIVSLSPKKWLFKSPIVESVLDKINKAKVCTDQAFRGIYQGVITGDNDVFYLYDCEVEGNIITGFSKLESRLLSIESNICKPLLSGKSANKWISNPSVFIIYPYENEDGEAVLINEDRLRLDFPLTFDYFNRNRDRLTARGSKSMVYSYWYAFWNRRKYSRFTADKIITPDICLGTKMSLDMNGYLYNDTMYALILSEEHKVYLLAYFAVLNSELTWFFLKETGNVVRGGYFRFKTKYLAPFKFPIFSDQQKSQLESLVTQIIALKKEEKEEGRRDDRDHIALSDQITALEAEIDVLVYRLYGLTYEEVLVVDPDFGMTAAEYGEITEITSL